jgi:hypothetical protein
MGVGIYYFYHGFGLKAFEGPVLLVEETGVTEENH